MVYFSNQFDLNMEFTDLFAIKINVNMITKPSKPFNSGAFIKYFISSGELLKFPVC